MTASQPTRVSAGVPTGGQFAATLKAESSVALSADAPLVVSTKRPQPRRAVCWVCSGPSIAVASKGTYRKHWRNDLPATTASGQSSTYSDVCQGSGLNAPPPNLDDPAWERNGEWSHHPWATRAPDSPAGRFEYRALVGGTQINGFTDDLDEARAAVQGSPAHIGSVTDHSTRHAITLADPGI